MEMLILFLLAVYGTSTLLVYEDGPWSVLKRFRKSVGAEYIQDTMDGMSRVLIRCDGSQLGKLFSCRLCCGWWVGALFTILLVICPYILFPFAGVGLTSMIQELSSNDS